MIEVTGLYALALRVLRTGVRTASAATSAT